MVVVLEHPLRVELVEGQPERDRPLFTAPHLRQACAVAQLDQVGVGDGRPRAERLG